MKRLPLALALCTVAVLLVLIVWRALEAVRTENATREAMVAQRVFDELERALQARLEREEARPFLHYNRNFLVDNDLALPASKTSPLGRPPSDPALVGYFQRAPDGTLSTPYRQPDGSSTLETHVVEAIEEELTRALEALPPTPLPPTRVSGPEQAGPPILQQLNKGLQSRARAPSVQSANIGQLGNFVDPTTTQTDARRAGVQVEPFQITSDARWLVFRRQVWLDGAPWTQGLVVRRAPLLQDVVREALGGLNGVTVRWGSLAGAHPHRFLPPFDDLTASLELAPLPGLRSTRVILGLVVLLLLVSLASAALVARWLAESARLARQRTDFVAAVTHELRTPLTSIRMYAEMLEQEMAPPEVRKDYLVTLRREAERLGALVEGVLTFATLERSGPVDLGPDAPLGTIATEVEAALRPLAAAKAVALDVCIDDGGVCLPRQALAQVLHNLIENAIKFTPREGRIEVTIDGSRLQVFNESPPLDPALLARLFEPFQRGERELTRRTRGTGIGLAVVRGLVRQLGGRISAQNVERGVIFCVVFPEPALDIH